MQRAARAAYITGSIAFLFIGLMHTAVHLIELSGGQWEAALRGVGALPIGADHHEVWDIWRGTSLLMGFFSVALGATNLAALAALPTTSWPPVGVCLTNVAMLLGITAAGVLYLGPIQAVGGPAGVLMFGLPLIGGLRAARGL